MKKLVKLLILLIIAALVVVFLSINSIVKSQIVAFGKNSMSFDVGISYVAANFFPPGLTIRGLSVDNENHDDPLKHFKAKKITVDVDQDSIFTDTIIINRVLISAPEVTYDTGLLGIGDVGKKIASGDVGGAVDWGVGFLNKAIGKIKGEKEEKKPAKKVASKSNKNGKKFIIKKFDIEKATFIPADEALWIKKGEKITLPDINMTNIDENSGENIGKHVKSVVKQAVVAELLRINAKRTQ